MKVKEILEAVSSWNKMYRRFPMSPEDRFAMDNKTEDQYWEEDHTRLDIPLELIDYARENFGAFYDKKRKGWYIKGSLPFELRSAIEQYKRKQKRKQYR